MDKSQIELQILQLSELQKLCNEIKDIESFKQNDDTLLKLLKKEYKLSAEEISTITLMVDGKKKGKSVDSTALDSLKKKFESYCLICEMNAYGKDGKFIGYAALSNKCSNKKSVLNKKYSLKSQN
ncbi:hypothetical protein [Aeromonas veronii]|uniref:hypothetical protein n=1 Tax=Aeromonas veronii TaxID=654 RepID=UPI003D2064FB